MNKIEKLLSVGDLRMAGNSEKVVAQVLSNPELFEDVINAVLIDSPPVRMRATDAIEKITRIHPDWLKPYKKQILDDFANISQKEVRWHIAQILPRLQLTKKEREKVYNLMLLYLNDKSSIVKTFSMQALTDIALQDRSYIDRVRKLVEHLIHEGTPAMKSRGKKLLVVIDSE